MNLASFDDVRRLEKTLGPYRLADAMCEAEPGWINERSWEFWHGRLALATGRAIPDAPPRRSFDAGQFEPKMAILPEPLNKKEIEKSFTFMHDARTIQEDENTLVVSAPMQSGAVKISFFGGVGIDRINQPLLTRDGTLLVASLEDLLATKLKAIMDRAEAKDYRDISVMLSASISLETALGAFAKMYGKDPGLPLRAMGFFKDGDLPSLPKSDQIFCGRQEIACPKFLKSQ